MGFIIGIVKEIRENAHDRINIHEDRLKRAEDDLKRTEKWAEREKTELLDKLAVPKKQLNNFFGSHGIDLTSRALGKKLSDSYIEACATADAFVRQI